MMSTTPPIAEEERQTARVFGLGTIRSRLLMAWIATILLSALVVSAAAIVMSLRTGRREAIDRLTLVAELRQFEIDEWIQGVKNTLAGSLQQAPEHRFVESEVASVVATLVDSPGDSEERHRAYDFLAYNFDLWLKQAQQFEVVFFMDRDGKVLVSTDPAMEGQILAEQVYFQRGTTGSYLAPVSYYESQARPITYSSRPILGEYGRLLGVLAGRVDASTLDRLMRLRERQSLGDTGESYLVSKDRTLVTESRFAEAGAEVTTTGVALALEEQERGETVGRYEYAPAAVTGGNGIYDNYVGTQVIGVYRWLPELQVALMVEQSRSEIFSAVYRAMILNGVVALVSALIAGAISLSITQGIGKRLSGLAETASAIAAGNLERMASVGRRDEIGTLAESFNSMTAQLRGLIGQLEQRVADRTRDLRRRAGQLEAAAEVARDAAAIRDVDELLDETVHLVSERFGFYHAGIFLVDDAKAYAVLRAASSEGGQTMLERGHRLRVGEVGIVGYVAGSGAPRIALDVGQDAVFFDNPDLPQTRSEMAVPLQVRGETLGVLDVQSTEAAAFDDEDVAVLQAMADQVAVAIENARLLEESQRAIRELQMAQGKRVQKAWGRGGQQARRLPAFEYDRVDVRPTDVSSIPVVDQALNSGQVVSAAGAGNGSAALAAPLRLRDHAIGAIALEESGDGRSWSQDDVDLVREVSEQVALALESARLFEEAQTRAQEQSVLSDLGQALAAQLEVDEVLNEAYRGASQLVDAENFFVGLHDPEQANIVIRFNAASAEADQEIRVLSADQGLSGYIIRTGESILIKGNLTECLADYGVELVGEPASSWLGVPLVVGGEVLGVMAVQSYVSDTAYDEHDLELLTAVASQTAIALESARLYEEAVETAERLREVDRLKSQFLANMSHELRTPLNSIIGFSRVVLKGIDGPITERQREDLSAIYSSGQHLLGLINDILDVSKIEAGKMELDFEPVNLKEIINGVMSTAVALVKDKPVDLQQSIPDDLAIITADERRVRQIMLNLVSNAAKFTDQGFIRIAAESISGQGPREVCMSVTDTGKGIAREELDKVFEPFTQVDASTTRDHGGTGLGLTISHSFVKLHGGRMWVESELGKGTTFYFTLPIEGPLTHVEDSQDPLDEAALIRPDGVSEEQSGPLVLCVDDDTGVINLYRRYLHLRGYRVFGLTDSRRVLDVAKRLNPYAITLDVMMPQKDGWDVIRELKNDSRTSDIPVIICSIVSEEERGMSLGAADYLVKPIMEEDLITALDRLGRDSGSHQVLVVDDHAEDRHLLRRMIESQDGYDVLEAAGGEDAIALVEERRPHIIILDLMMPEVDGFAVLESVKSNELTRSIPIIVVTAKTLTEEDHRRLNHRVETLVHKGVLKQEDLLEDVAKALRKLERRRA